MLAFPEKDNFINIIEQNWENGMYLHHLESHINKAVITTNRYNICQLIWAKNPKRFYSAHFINTVIYWKLTITYFRKFVFKRTANELNVLSINQSMQAHDLSKHHQSKYFCHGLISVVNTHIHLLHSYAYTCDYFKCTVEFYIY